MCRKTNRIYKKLLVHIRINLIQQIQEQQSFFTLNIVAHRLLGKGTDI